jgi:hypothetical protein
MAAPVHQLVLPIVAPPMGLPSASAAPALVSSTPAASAPQAEGATDSAPKSCPACARLALGGRLDARGIAAALGVPYRSPERYDKARDASVRERADLREAARRGGCIRHLAQALVRTSARIQRDLGRIGLAKPRGPQAAGAGAGRRSRLGLPSDEQIREAARKLCLTEAVRMLRCSRAALVKRAAELGVTFQPYSATSDAPEMLVACPACGAQVGFWCRAVLRASSSGAEIHSFHKARVEIAPVVSVEA